MYPYSFTFVDQKGNTIEDDVYVRVMTTAGADATLYTDEAGATAKTNPITPTVFEAANGICKFYCGESSLLIDAHIRNNGLGGSVTATITPTTHTIRLDWDANEFKLVIPFTNTATVETATGVYIPAFCEVVDVGVEVVTNVADATIDIGTANGTDDPDGLADGASCATAGWVRPEATVTDGDNTHYFSANVRGALLSDYEVGTDADTDEGTYREKPMRLSAEGTAEQISYTTNDKAIAGYFVVFCKKHK